MDYWPASLSVWYVDGTRITQTPVSNLMTTLIAATTRVIAVKGTNSAFNQYHYIWADLNNGIVSDVSWKCTSEVQDDDEWTTVGFDDSAWPNAVEKRHEYRNIHAIWSNCSACPIAYCRKVIQCA